MNKYSLLSLVCALFLFGFSTGCETTEGAGRDIQSAGEALEDAAN